MAGLLAGATLAVVVVAHPFRNGNSIGDTARAMCGGEQASPVCIRLVSQRLRNNSLPRPGEHSSGVTPDDNALVMPYAPPAVQAAMKRGDAHVYVTWADTSSATP